MRHEDHHDMSMIEQHTSEYGASCLTVSTARLVGAARIEPGAVDETRSSSFFTEEAPSVADIVGANKDRE
jgi:hypothetical protein